MRVQEFFQANMERAQQERSQFLLFSGIANAAGLVATVNLVGGVDAPDAVLTALTPSLLGFGAGLALFLMAMYFAGLGRGAETRVALEMASADALKTSHLQEIAFVMSAPPDLPFLRTIVGERADELVRTVYRGRMDAADRLEEFLRLRLEKNEGPEIAQLHRIILLGDVWSRVSAILGLVCFAAAFLYAVIGHMRGLYALETAHIAAPPHANLTRPATEGLPAVPRLASPPLPGAAPDPLKTEPLETRPASK